MTEQELKTAAFAKMARGEALSLQDAQRVWEVVLNHGLNIDSANQGAVGQFIGAQLKPALQQKFFAQNG